MKSNILKILVPVLSILLFVGCSRNLSSNAIQPSDRGSHGVLYQANYDIKCVHKNSPGFTLIIDIQEGQFFAVDNLGGAQLGGKGLINDSGRSSLPEHTLGVKAVKPSTGNEFWLAIYPNGDFISKDGVLVQGVVGKDAIVLWRGTCTTHEDQQPFKLVNNQ